jgi:hypothetical protein
MITISITSILFIFLSIIVWACLSGFIITLMWGNDWAFIVGPVVSFIIIICLWLWYLGMIRFV